MVGSQTYTTVTNVNTVTTTGTYTQMSAYPVATTTVTRTSTDILFNRTFVAQRPGSNAYCTWQQTSFDLGAGQRIQGNFTASQGVDFFIFTDNEYTAWKAAGLCDPKERAKGAEVSRYSLMSSTFDYTPQTTGKYWFAFNNYPGQDTKISLTVIRQYAQVVTAVSQATTSNQLLITATRTTSTMSTGTIAQVSPPVALDPLVMIGIVIVIVALIAGFVVYRSRSKPKEQ